MKIKSFLRFISPAICAVAFLPFLMGMDGLSGGGCSSKSSSQTVRVTPSGDGHESFTPSTPQVIELGTTQSFTLSANFAYVLSTNVGGTCPAGSWVGSVYTTGAITSSCTVIFSAMNPNVPWYPSLSAFEAYDSGRSRLFSLAIFAGNFTGVNTVDTLDSAAGAYPSLTNIAYIDEDQIFAYGGGYGNESGSMGAFVAKINPETLEPEWFNQLIDTSTNGEWDYPGVLGILDDGYLYVVYGYRLSKLNPSTGEVISTLELPTGAGLPENTSYDGFDATPEGLFVMKTLYRQAGCTVQGPAVFIDCPDPSDVPNSILVSVNPQSMTVLDEVSLTSNLTDRLTIGTYNGQNYVYFWTLNSWVRYSLSSAGELSFDNSWDPQTLLLNGQRPGSSLVIMGDWVLGQTNALPGSTALSLIAVNQGDASQQFSIQPFLGDPIPADISAAYSFSGPGGAQAVSWMPSPVSVDSEANIVYSMDSFPGEIAAYSLDATGFTLLWKTDQRTTEALAIIGAESERMIVGTDIPTTPTLQVPGLNTEDFVVWRNAATGEEIARSALLPAITPAGMVQPYYSGDMFYGSVAGRLYQLIPVSAP